MTNDRPGRQLAASECAGLNHVKVSTDPVDLTLFPDFVVIGPQRTGSTWLHRNLTRHPEIFMSDPKELYYFSSVQWPDSHPAQLPPIEVDLEWYLRFFDEPNASVAARRKQCKREFGVDYAPKVRGEASATYAAACQEPVIDDMLTLNPDLKAVMLVRHPHERTWSHVKKELSMDGGRSVDSITLQDCEEFLRKTPYEVKCSLFSDIIAKWRGKLGDRLFVGDFRDIEAKPGELLTRLFRFLGVDDDPRFVGDLADVQICYTAPRPVPDEVRPVFDELYSEELRKLADLGFTW